MDLLDLDAILPPKKQIKINGKIIDVYPLTIRQLITVAQLETRLTKINDETEIMPLIKGALVPFVPALKDDDSIDFTLGQLKELIKFAQSVSVPSDADEAKKYTTEKKIDSPSASPPSSTTTPATPVKKS